jgi:type I restriction enzyme S subunit
MARKNKCPSEKNREEEGKSESFTSPRGWKVKKIGDLIEDIFDYRGRTPKKLGMQWGGGQIKAISANNVEMGRLNFEKETNYGSETLYKKWMTKGDLEKGDVIITLEAPLGNVAQIPDNDKYILSQRVVVLKNKPDVVDKDFLKSILMSFDFQKQLKKNATGTTATGIQQKRLVELYSLLPSIPEQHNIVKILTTVDATISKTESIIAKIETLKSGLMQEFLVNGSDYSPSKHVGKGKNARNAWKKQKLIEFADVVMGTSPDGKSYNFNGIGEPLINGPAEFGEIHPTPVQWTTEPTKMCNNGDILFCVRGSTTARMNIADQKYCIGRGIAAIRGKTNRGDTTFIKFLLSMTQEKIFNLASGGGSTFPNITSTLLCELKFIVPPLSTQKQIASIVTSVENQLHAEKKYRASLLIIKNGLMQDLLTGKVPVIPGGHAHA